MPIPPRVLGSSRWWGPDPSVFYSEFHAGSSKDYVEANGDSKIVKTMKKAYNKYLEARTRATAEA